MKTALITGASSGIGMEYAKRFAKEGYQLILVARREQILKALAEQLKQESNTTCTVIPIDLSEDGAAQKIYEKVQGLSLQVDVLINNAGFATKGMLEWADYEKQHKEMHVNIVSLVELTYFFIPQMAQRRSGTIINLSSAAGFNPIPYNSVYSASKAFVLSFSQGIAYEYKKYGVHVMAVCPQATDTHFFDEFNKMEGKMRTAQNVVDTTMKAVRKKKTVAADGFFCKVQAVMHHILTRKMIVKITGAVGGSVWGKSDSRL